jgi:ribose 1,5-bisphosphokinase PhnN
MNNKIIWIFGPSAAGKETFINYINAKPFELKNSREGREKVYKLINI